MDFYSGRGRNRTGKEKNHSSPPGSTPKAIKIISAFLLLAGSLHAQEFAQLEITFDHHFFLAQEDSLIRPASSLKFKLDSLASGNRKFWIITDSSFKKGFFEINCLPGKKYSFRIVEESELVVNLIGEETISTRPEPTPKKNQKGKKIKADSTTADRIYPDITFEELFRRVNTIGYSGKTGCKLPISDVSFARNYEPMQQLLFERERIQAAKKFISASCLLSRQLGKLLELTEFDDTRLELVTSARGQIFDLENLRQLAEKFNLTSHREKFLKSIENH